MENFSAMSAQIEALEKLRETTNTLLREGKFTLQYFQGPLTNNERLDAQVFLMCGIIQVKYNVVLYSDAAMKDIVYHSGTRIADDKIIEPIVASFARNEWMKEDGNTYSYKDYNGIF